MFKYINLHNYKSLIDFNVDLMSTRKKPKKMILIYGENGVGKSNFATAFYTLSEFLKTKSVKDIWDHIREKEDKDKDDAFIQKFLRDNFCDTEAIIKKCKTINSKDNMILEFGFNYKGYNGVYYLETNNTRIVAERLEYVLNKNLTTLFDISDNQTPKINSNIFKIPRYEDEILDLIEKYWGKHSLLSILTYEIEDKADGYVKKRITKNLYDIILFFNMLSLRVKEGNRVERSKIRNSHQIFKNLDNGEIPLSEEVELDKTENLLNEFFTHLYSDIKQVYYKKEFKDDKLNYNLFLKKQVYDQLIEVDFSLESTGTQCLLEILPYLIDAVEGNTVIIDELDTGIHDLLIETILENMYNSVKGQIIITTHNTMFLESDLAKDCVYVFKLDKDANKELVPLTSYEERIHPNLNIRKRYLKGMYGGIPMVMDIDFNDLLENME